MAWTLGQPPPPLTQEQLRILLARLDGFTPEGVFRSPYSYLIDFDGTDYYANNAFQVIYGGPEDEPGGTVDGADPNAVIQAVLDDTSAIDVFFNPAIYPTTSDLILPERFISLRGVPYKSIFRPAADNITIMRYADGEENRNGLILDGLMFDGVNQTGGDGVFLYNLTNGYIRNCQFKDMYGFGLFTSPDTGVDGRPKAGRVSADLLIAYNDFENCGRGVGNDMFGGGWFDNSIIAFNKFKNSLGCSIDHVAPTNSLYFGNRFKFTIYKDAGPAVLVSDGGMSHCTISHNIFSTLGARQGVYLASSFGGVADFGAPEHNDIIDNRINDCSTAITVTSATGGTGPLDNLIARNRIRDATNPIYLLDGTKCEVSDNQIINWNKNESVETLPRTAIAVDTAHYSATDITVRDNKLAMTESRTTRGVYIFGVAQNVVNIRVFDNDLAAATYPISYGEGGGHTVTFARVNGNIGDLTDNCGLTAAAASPITVNHGLSGIPIFISADPVSVSVVPNVADVNAASFTINWAEGGNVAFFWHAKKTA